MLLVEALTSEHRSEWEQFTSTCPEATFFHTYEWQKMLQLGVRNERPKYWGLWLDDELVAIWPTSVVPAFGGLVLYSLPHSNFGAPIIKEGANIALLHELISPIYKQAKNQGVLHWATDVQKESGLLGNARHWGFDIRPSSKCTFTIDASLGADLIWKRLSNKVRNAVRGARKLEVKVSESRELEGLNDYFQIYKSTMKRHGRMGLDWQFFVMMHSSLVKDRKARVFLASDHGRVIAGIILLLHRGNAYWWSGASLSESWRMNPNELLLWHALEWASNSGIRSFDLGLTPAEETSGLNLFKRHLGGERIDLVRLTLPINRVRNLLATGIVNCYRKLNDLGLVPRILIDHLQPRVWFD